jgi:hypothetical protein
MGSSYDSIPPNHSLTKMRGRDVIGGVIEESNVTKVHGFWKKGDW